MISAFFFVEIYETRGLVIVLARILKSSLSTRPVEPATESEESDQLSNSRLRESQGVFTSRGRNRTLEVRTIPSQKDCYSQWLRKYFREPLLKNADILGLSIEQANKGTQNKHKFAELVLKWTSSPLSIGFKSLKSWV